MAEVSILGGLVTPTPNGATAAQGISEVYSGNIFPVVVAGMGGMLSALPGNLQSASAGVHTVIPGVRQGVLAAGLGGLIDFTEWRWKIRFLPWCTFDAPLVRARTVYVTPYTNDPAGLELAVSIDWGDGTIRAGCRSGYRYQHTYPALGRYQVTVRATNQLGDSAAVSRDVYLSAPTTEDAPWLGGASPGAVRLET